MTVREIGAEAVTASVARLLIEANTQLGTDVVEDFPLLVVDDVHANDLYEEGAARCRAV